MPRWLYSLLLRCALPFAAGAYLLRGWRQPVYRGSLRGHLALGHAPLGDRPVWLHAASVGEVRALASLVESLHAEGVPLLLTVGTPTGLASARQAFAGMLAASAPATFTVQPAPWDVPGAVARFISAARPRAGVFVETELWPNLVAGARRAQVPLLLVSARLSARSLQRYQRWAPVLLRDTVQAFSAIGAQSQADAQRFIALGASPAVVSVIGNLKSEQPLAPQVREQGEALRARWAPERPLWVAGSTHAADEQACLAAQRRLMAAAQGSGHKAPLLVLAPRRPERFERVAQAIARENLFMARSSRLPDGPELAPEVVLVDEMDTLPGWYAAADAAFVGGSLAALGGHNLLEPAQLGKPVLAGPHHDNAPDIAAALLAGGGLRLVRDGADLARQLAQLLGDPQQARAEGARAAAAAAAQRGATARARSLLANLA